MIRQRKPVQRAFTGLVGHPPDPATFAPAPTPDLTSPAQTHFAVNRGRPPKHKRAMTPAERKRASRQNDGLRDKKGIDKIIAILVKHQSVDKRTGGAHGGGKYMRGAPAGKGLLVTGGYDSKKVDEVIGAHDRDAAYGGRNSRPGGQGPQVDEDVIENDHDFTGRAELKTEYENNKGEAVNVAANEQEMQSSATLDGLNDEQAPDEHEERKHGIGVREDKLEIAVPGRAGYSAAYNAEWTRWVAREEDREIGKILMQDVHVRLLCRKRFPLETSEEEAYRHAADVHPGSRAAIRTRTRCIVCNRIRCDWSSCELTPEDKRHNADCELEIFKMAGIQKRKMTPFDVAHRRAIATARRAIRGVS